MHMRRKRSAWADFIKSMFGLSLYTFYLLNGRISWYRNIQLTIGVIALWAGFLILPVAAFAHPHPVSFGDRVFWFAIIGIFIFFGWILHMKITDEHILR